MVNTGQCTRIICYLSEQGGGINFPLVTIAGLVDGVNPCAIGMMIMLLGYLLVFAKKPERIIKTGLVYITSVFVTYLVVGLSLYSFVSQFDLTGGAAILRYIIALALLIAGLIQLKDFWGIEKGPHLRIPTASKEYLMKWIEKSSYPATIILGFLVTILETPCSLPLYVGTATVLSQSGMPLPIIALYFLYYNFLFILPLIIVLVVLWRGKKLIEVKEWEHKAKRWMHLGLGLTLILMTVWLLLG